MLASNDLATGASSMLHYTEAKAEVVDLIV